MINLRLKYYFSFFHLDNYYFESQDLYVNVTIDEEDHKIKASPSPPMAILKGNLLLSCRSWSCTLALPIARE